MKQNNYWLFIFTLETILIILLFQFQKDLIRQGELIAGNVLKFILFGYIFYSIYKNISKIIN